MPNSPSVLSPLIHAFKNLRDRFSFQRPSAENLKNSSRSAVYRDFQSPFYSREYDRMRLDPIISRALDTLVDTAFQPFSTGEPVRCITADPTLRSAVTGSIAKLNTSSLLSGLCYQLLVDGNVCVRHYFSVDRGIDHIEVLKSWSDFIPFQVGSKILFYVPKDRNHSQPFEYPWNFSFMQLPGSVSSEVYKDIVLDMGEVKTPNAFTPSVSYLRPCVEPWRRYVFSLMSLATSRVDRVDYKRIMQLPVDRLSSKNTEATLEYYASLSAGSRNHIVGDHGLATGVDDFSRTPLLYMPYLSNSAPPNLIEVGGQEDVSSIRDVEEHRSLLSTALRVPVQYLGFDQEGSAGLSGESPTSRYDESFGRSVKAIQRTVINLLRDVIFVDLLAQNYNLDKDDIKLVAVNPSNVDDEKQRISVLNNIQAFNDVTSSVEGLLEYLPGFDKETFIQDVWGKTVSPSLDLDIRDYYGDSEGVSEESVRSDSNTRVSNSKKGIGYEEFFRQEVRDTLSSRGVLKKFLESARSDSKMDVSATEVDFDQVVRYPDWYLGRQGKVSLKADPIIKSAKEFRYRDSNTRVSVFDVFLGYVGDEDAQSDSELLVYNSSRCDLNYVLQWLENPSLSVSKLYVTKEGYYLAERNDYIKCQIMRSRNIHLVPVDEIYKEV